MTRSRLFLTLSVAAAAVLGIAAPASAITLTLPTIPLPAPLEPIQLPVSGSVTGGTGGAPIQVGVTAPGSTSINVVVPGITVPALPKVPTVPGAPTTPVTVPTATPIPSDPTVGVPSSPASPVAAPGQPAGPGQSPAPEVGAPLPSVSAWPGSPAQPLAAPKGATTPARAGRVTANTLSPAPDSFISALPTVAARLLLWVALAALVLAMYAFVSSALAQHRRRAARVS